MKLSDYSYDLPVDLIANKPPKVRGGSRLMVLHRKTGEIEDRRYVDVVEYLKPGDLLVLNDTKVIKARLLATKNNGAKRELVILEKHSHDCDWYLHNVMYRQHMSAGDELTIGDVRIRVEKILGGGVALIKSSHNLLEVANQYGEVPLPPYMRRRATSDDIERYQSVWAAKRGSVAAPTASLNMTNETLRKLENKGVNIKYLTLHVGLGTFLPIRTDNIEDHHMHQEYFEIPDATISAISNTKNAGGRVIALGTTVARTLEYASDNINNFDPKFNDLTGEADIFIYPGYNFKLIDGLITNYHAPKSTVLMLTAAFAGWDKLLPAYNHAVCEKYHFFSYGDSMLIL